VQQEKEALAKLKEDPTAVNPDDESLRRLQQLKQRQRPEAAVAVAAGDEDDDEGGAGAGQEQREPKRQRADAGEGEAAEQRRGSGGAAAGASGGDAAADDEDEEGGAAGGGVDPFAGLSGRQRKLLEIKQKLQQGRKANEHAVIAERKRMQVRGASGVQRGGWGVVGLFWVPVMRRCMRCARWYADTDWNS